MKQTGQMMKNHRLHNAICKITCKQAGKWSS